MAADKALIAGAAKVAGAKAKLDNATLDAFTDLGEVVGKHAESVLADMLEKENARNEAIADGLSTINSQSIKLPNDHVGTLYDTPSTQEIYNKPVGTLTSVLNIQGANFNYDAQTTQNKDVMDQQKAAQTMSNVVTSEMEKRNGYLATVQDAGFKYSPFHDIKSEEGKAAQAYLDGTAKWEPKEPGGDPNSYGYKVGNKFYTTAQMQKIVGNATAPDNSKEVFDFLDNSSKRSFKTATNNKEADVISARIKSEILANENTLNNFLVHRAGGMSLQTLKGQPGFKAEDEIDRFISEQKAMHYDAPEPVEVEEEETETDTPYFLAQKSMLDKILSNNKLGENMYKLGKSPSISYYKSKDFKKMLPPQLTLVQEGDVVQIQDERNTNINHIIDPELSLEYNIKQLEALLRSKKP